MAKRVFFSECEQVVQLDIMDAPALSLFMAATCLVKRLVTRRSPLETRLLLGGRPGKGSNIGDHIVDLFVGELLPKCRHRRLHIDHRPFEFEVGVAEFGPLISPYSWIVRAHQSEEGLRSCEIHR